MGQEENIRDKNINEWLLSDNLGQISKAIEIIREEGRTALFPNMFSVYAGLSAELQEKVNTLVIDLKSQEAVPYICEYLAGNEDKEIIGSIVTACWQNGQDYSQYMSIFVNIVLQNNYEIAFDAFTVIEESSTNLSSTELNKLISTVKQNIPSKEDPKMPLIVEMVKMLSQNRDNALASENIQ